MARILEKGDVVFECFHNFVAFSQWGNTIFGIMSRLSRDGGDPDIRAAFEKTMSAHPDAADGAPFTPLEMFVMELFLIIRRMAAASRRCRIRGRVDGATTMATVARPLRASACLKEHSGYIISPDTSTSFDSEMHWTNPLKFEPFMILECADQRPGGRGKKASRSASPNAALI